MRKLTSSLKLPSYSEKTPHLGRLSGFLTVSLGASMILSGCFFETKSSIFKDYKNENPSYAHSSQIQLMMNDFGGLSTDTLKTNAFPWKVVVASVVTKRHYDQGADISKDTFQKVLKEYGFILPDKILNLKEGVPQPKLEFPVGIVRGDLEINIGLKPKTEIANFTCATCHSSRVFNAQGRATNDMWLGAPNASMNLQGYTSEIYESLKFVGRSPSEFNRNLKTIFPEITHQEYESIKKFFYPETIRQMNIIEKGSNTLLSFFNGPPGSANGIGSLKRVIGMTGPGIYDPQERGFVNIPDFSDRKFRRNLTVSGIYTPLGETPLTEVTEDQATNQRAWAISPVAALFLSMVMGEPVAKTEKQIPVMQEVFADFISNYKAPKFPGELDEIKALRGEKLYNNSCVKCHGQYSAGVNQPHLISYPNVLIPVDKIGTDKTRLEVLDKKFRYKTKDYWVSQKIQVIYRDGYMAPILSNLWSSAPYLHNGSVPTLWALMNPEVRPQTFYTGGHALDFKKVGITYYENETPYSKPVLVDTRERGSSNKGHEKSFAKLSSEEKWDLIEYLKTL